MGGRISEEGRVEVKYNDSGNFIKFLCILVNLKKKKKKRKDLTV